MIEFQGIDFSLKATSCLIQPQTSISINSYETKKIVSD